MPPPAPRSLLLMETQSEKGSCCGVLVRWGWVKACYLGKKAARMFLGPCKHNFEARTNLLGPAVRAAVPSQLLEVCV